MKYYVTIILAFLGFYGIAQTQLDPKKAIINTKLNLPFGTICKLDVEIFDGDELQLKEFTGVFLLKIKAINDKPQNENLIISFIDETGQLANDGFELFELINKKSSDEISSEVIKELKKNYVGKKMTIMAYESGIFSGMPDGYFKYRPVRADSSFRFKNYLIVIKIIKKKTKKRKNQKSVQF